MTKAKSQVIKFYDQEASKYTQQYQPDYSEEYPANAIRLKMVMDLLKKQGVKKVLDIGCGSGKPMIELMKNGYDVVGFDFSKEMVKAGKHELKKAGFFTKRIFHDDLECPKRYIGKHDAVLALGVFPHNIDDKKALKNIREWMNDMNPDSRAYIEFRNELFAAYTMNGYSFDFFLNRLIEIDELDLNDDFINEVAKFYYDRLHIEKLQRKGKKIKYTDILARFHNPLTIDEELLRPNGLALEKLHFYHFHAFPPFFEKMNKKLFWEKSMKLENPNSWKGYLMASAFVAEVKKV